MARLCCKLLLALALVLMCNNLAAGRNSNTRQLRDAEEDAEEGEVEGDAEEEEEEQEEEHHEEEEVQEQLKDVYIKDLLDLEDYEEQDNTDNQDEEDLVGFFATSKKFGQPCTTPEGAAGTCHFLFDSACSSVRNKFLQLGGLLSPQGQDYFSKAIRPPCGFELFDFTMCCPSSSAPPPPTPGGSCGISSNSNAQKIVGGVEAQAQAWPWAVVLGRPGSPFQVSCGGTLINSNTVLTAAHCFGFSGQPSFARVGDTDIASIADGTSGRDIKIGTVTQHPNWNPRTLENDITILKLTQTVQYDRFTRWACLPNQYQNLVLSDALRNPNPTIIGWGSTRTGGGSQTKLRQAQVPMVVQSVCVANYQSVSTIRNTQLCAGNGQVDTCNGDSGGALLASNIGNVWSVVGITSFGVDCAREGYPGVYTRVDKYLPWINSLL